MSEPGMSEPGMSEPGMSKLGRPVVVLVHGLWFGAWAMALLARRLRQAGFAVRYFRYRSTRQRLGQAARALAEFACSVGAPPHFVCHSMGGLVTLRMLAEAPNPQFRRVVLLGSPLQGSDVARRAARLPGGKRLLGAARPALEAGYTAVTAGSEVGAIAGTRSFGLGWLVGGLGGPGDGTVALAETRSDALSDRMKLPVTHTGMLISRKVAGQVVEFLRHGRFDLSRTGPTDRGAGAPPPRV